MLTLNIISDLHLLPQRITEPETFTWGLFKPELLEPADYLLIAGDLGLASNYDTILTALRSVTKGKFKNVFAIKGNHDYWHPRRVVSKEENFTKHKYLEEHLDSNTVLLGCTMWTPIPEYKGSDMGSWHRSPEKIVHSAMNDFRSIPDFGMRTYRKLHDEEVAWLRDKVNFHKASGKRVVVMTHHCPRKELIGGKYPLSDPLNYAYYVMDGSMDDLKPDLWLCGHSHSFYDQVIDGVRYVRHPIGYHAFDYFLEYPENPDIQNWYNYTLGI